MNKVSLVGRLTKDPDVRYTQGSQSVAVCRFTLAVDRKVKKSEEKQADFISCVAFGKTAEFIEKYFFKGMRLGGSGRIQTGSYAKNDGTKVYTTDVVLEEVEFVESKGQQSQSSRPSADSGAIPQIGDEFMSIPDGVEDMGLPFN